MTRADLRALLCWLMRRSQPDAPTDWKDRVRFVQANFGVALTTAQQVASGRLGKLRAEQIRKLMTWDGRQHEILTPPPERSK